MFDDQRRCSPSVRPCLIFYRILWHSAKRVRHAFREDVLTEPVDLGLMSDDCLTRCRVDNSRALTVGIATAWD